MQKNLVIVIFVAGAFILGFWGEDLTQLFDKSETTETASEQNPQTVKPGTVKVADKAQAPAVTIQAGSKAEMDLLYRPAVTADNSASNPASTAVNTSAGDWKSFAESVSASSPRQIEDSRRAQQNLYFQKLREQMAELKLKENESSDPVTTEAQPTEEANPLAAENPTAEIDDQQGNYTYPVEGDYTEDELQYDDHYDYSYE